jgi:biopolymer transport protein TolR
VTPYRIKQHRKRAHHGSHMALVPFIDMLTMLVVFLLLHSSDAEILPNTKNIQIPESIADLKPHETVTIMVTKDELLVNGRIVGKVAEVAAMQADKMIIPDLQVALKEQNDRIQRETAKEDLAEREITIMGDKTTPFSVLKRVMATATASDYGKVSLAVIQREREAGAGA